MTGIMRTTLYFAGRALAALMLVSLLNACISTQEASKYQVDEAKALDSHVTLALKYIEGKNRESARHHLRKAMEIDPRSVEANYALAMLYQLEGEMDLADNQFEKTLRLDSSYSRARNNYGAMLFDEGHYEAAFKQFDLAAKDLDYDARPQALVNLGRTALKLGNTKKAESAFEHAARLAPAMAVVKYELAELNFAKGEYKVAKQYLDAYEQIARPAPQTLLLGIKMERVFGNSDREASYALLLKNKYPYSKEYLEYKSMLEQSEK
ncbi:type IV pilus biogenesis/stability protein PilW [Gilvimarinus sp. SDUM040013]|uniref:Type IV pilus biogenesis/stability protein PilW n=1 Tax=Gilvimarinus gilvus TaxID=3058038 RepID=A0ABU4RUE5_9GAMM|nr:type IV pilus biogenesis/stability protein PilW [Gilvimarinus sp. SDUM040013]MDO3385125.1 type IV pilus biogenesis/stability protein PilW [Gilvimarinus sp. SDUM040013]MDX6848500.1 type IV pilus biogenesis/stability protein PilW [Gilvimarinus sp. SDUM040013]